MRAIPLLPGTPEPAILHKHNLNEIDYFTELLLAF